MAFFLLIVVAAARSAHDPASPRLGISRLAASGSHLALEMGMSSAFDCEHEELLGKLTRPGRSSAVTMMPSPRPHQVGIGPEALPERKKPNLVG